MVGLGEAAPKMTRDFLWRKQPQGACDGALGPPAHSACLDHEWGTLWLTRGSPVAPWHKQHQDSY